jgi:hypothetical protein
VVLLLILDQAYVGQEMGHVIHPPMKVIITKGSKIATNRAFERCNSEFCVIIGRKPSS